jgi:hypothetical protein
MIMERVYAETLSFTDMFSNPTVQLLYEDLGIEDTSLVRDLTKFLEENFEIISDYSNVLAIDLTDRLAISFHLEDDKFLGTNFHIPGLNEFIGLVEDKVLHYKLGLDEYITLISDYVRNSANGTISTILITGNPFISKDDFMNTVTGGHIPDYGKFSTFIQGNYEYQKALFKTTMIPADTSNQIRLSALKLTVDLVDINNSGFGEIEEKDVGLIVSFDREYTRTDNINVRAIQTSGGSYAIPEVTGITKQGCTIKLKETNETYIVGYVSWTATGD